MDPPSIEGSGSGGPVQLRYIRTPVAASHMLRMKVTFYRNLAAHKGNYRYIQPEDDFGCLRQFGNGQFMWRQIDGRKKNKETTGRLSPATAGALV
jgi:hypothetical protein